MAFLNGKQKMRNLAFLALWTPVLALPSNQQCEYGWCHVGPSPHDVVLNVTMGVTLKNVGLVRRYMYEYIYIYIYTAIRALLLVDCVIH